MANRVQPVLGALGGDQWSVSNERAKDEQKDKDLRKRLMEGAALAMRMNDQTALGYGLGTLLFSNWDKWFGGGGGNNNGGNGNATPYDFSKNMNAAKDPMQLAIGGGDKHAAWAAEHNQPFNLMAVQQNPTPISATPLPNNQTVGGVNMQTATPTNTIQPNIPLTQQLTIGGQDAGTVDPGKAITNSNFNPANSSNAFTSAMNNPPNLVDIQNNALGGLGAFGANNYNASPLSGAADAVKDFNFEDWLKNRG